MEAVIVDGLSSRMASVETNDISLSRRGAQPSVEYVYLGFGLTGPAERNDRGILTRSRELNKATGKGLTRVKQDLPTLVSYGRNFTS